LRDRRRRDVPGGAARRQPRSPAPPPRRPQLPPLPPGAPALPQSVPRRGDYARARSGVLLPDREALRVARASYISRPPSNTSAAAWGWRGRLGSAWTGKVSGSPNWTVIFGNSSRFQRRTRAEPWIATGTIGAPDSRAMRPIPGFGAPSSPERERPPSA